MDSLITFLVVLILSALGAWIKKLTQKGQEEDSSAPPVLPGQRPPMQRPQQKPVSWEEELRRLLGEEAPLPPRQKPLAPPPPIAPRPVPPPTASKAVPPKPVVAPTPIGVGRAPVPTVQRVSTGELARVKESRKAYERASQLDKLAAERLKKVSGQPVMLTSVVQRAQPSEEGLQAVRLVKNARAAREAIIASIILGPPKALEEM